MSLSPTYKFARAAMLGAGLLLAAGSPLAAADKPADRPYGSPTQAYRLGLGALDAGRGSEAIAALGFAADGGVIGARLKLAEMYRLGIGVEADPARAFEHYRVIADQYADISPRHPLAIYVAKAFVALGGYYRSGIEARGVKADAAHAGRLYQHAASYFGDAEAQYQLARLYLTGEGLNRNTRLAVNWLANAARKQHAASQALLGDILWRGLDDIQRQPLKGLALLSLARQNAAGSEDAEWIEDISSRALDQADAGQRELASKLYDKWRGPADRAPNVASAPAISPDAAAALDMLTPLPLLPVEAVTPVIAPEASATSKATIR